MTRRYSAGDFRSARNKADHNQMNNLADLLDQAAKTESQVMRLVEAVTEYMRCTSVGFTGPTSELVNAWKAVREALSKFRGGENG